MNNTERIKALNNGVGWEISFQTATSQEALYFSTYDEVISFLRDEKGYWKNREKGVSYPVPTYSGIVNNHIAVIEATMKDISSETVDINTALSHYNAYAKEYGVAAASQGQNRVANGRNRQSVRITISCVKSTTRNADAVSFAYKSLYLKGFTTRFDTFVTLAVLPKNQGETVQKYLGNVSDDQQQGAIDYLAYMIKNSGLPNKDLFAQDIIADYDTQLTSIKDALIEKRKEIEEFTEESASSFKEQFDEQQKSLDTQTEDIEKWYESEKEDFEKTKILYSESLKFKEPAKHWEDEANKQRIRYNKSLAATVVLSVVLIAAVAALLYFMVVRFDYDQISKFVPQSFFMIGLIAFLFYIIRTFIKITLSAKQLETVYNEKCAFTYFYLALLQDNTIKIEPNERILVFNTLFSKSETGLVKGTDGKTDTEATLFALLGRN